MLMGLARSPASARSPCGLGSTVSPIPSGLLLLTLSPAELGSTQSVFNSQLSKTDLIALVVELLKIIRSASGCSFRSAAATAEEGAVRPPPDEVGGCQRSFFLLPVRGEERSKGAAAFGVFSAVDLP